MATVLYKEHSSLLKISLPQCYMAFCCHFPVFRDGLNKTGLNQSVRFRSCHCVTVTLL